MKDVGYTQDGNRLVEMNETEYAHFGRLCIAVEDRYPPAFSNPRDYAFHEDFDFSKTFEVIRAIYEGRFRVTELQGFLDRIRESLSE